MSPVAPRRYMVIFSDYATLETVVLAASKREALAKAKAMYALNNLRDFDAYMCSFTPLKNINVIRISEGVSYEPRY